MLANILNMLDAGHLYGPVHCQPSQFYHLLHSFIAISLIELPPVFVLILLMDIWGRKPLMATSLIIPVRNTEDCTEHTLHWHMA